MRIAQFNTEREDQKSVTTCACRFTYELLRSENCSIWTPVGRHFTGFSAPKFSHKCIHGCCDHLSKSISSPMMKDFVFVKKKLRNSVWTVADALSPSDNKTGAIIFSAEPNANHNLGKFYRDLNDLLDWLNISKLKTTGHLPPNLSPSRLFVVPSTEPPIDMLDSPNTRFVPLRFERLVILQSVHKVKLYL